MRDEPLRAHRHRKLRAPRFLQRRPPLIVRRLAGAMLKVTPGSQTRRTSRVVIRRPAEPPADGEVLICCAHPDTDIVVDM